MRDLLTSIIGAHVSRLRCLSLLAVSAVSFIVTNTPGQCDPHWAGGEFCVPGLNGFGYASIVWNDGSGEALYVGGLFGVAGCADTPLVARWDGDSWSGLGTGISGDEVSAIAVFDDGRGPALFVGGEFTYAGGVSTPNIARWDGNNWSAVGEGTSGHVRALAVYDDGSGPALYAAGRFSSAGAVTASSIAKWDGNQWSALSPDIVSNAIYDLEVYNDGSGPGLYACGTFPALGPALARHIARWDGNSWSPLADGLESSPYTMQVFDDGGGPALYVGGSFDNPDSIRGIARWDGTAWSNVGGGLAGASDICRSLRVLDDGTGPALYAAGYFHQVGTTDARFVARWDGSGWSPLGDGLDSQAHTIIAFDAGFGPEIYATGNLYSQGTVNAANIARWNGSAWSPLNGGINNTFLGRLDVLDDGSGPALYTTGNIINTNGFETNTVAKWNGSLWAPLLPDMNNVVRALAVFDDGSGPAIFAAGQFDAVGSVTALRFARWNGVAWDAPAFFSATVTSLLVFNDGTGESLYAGGSFGSVSGVSANRIARWDGTDWYPLGSGVAGGSVLSIVSFDDGTGEAIYVGGSFNTAGGSPAARIARWNGTSWSDVGGGVTGGSVSELIVFDDGNGAALYAAGAFTEAGGVQTMNIAKWNGNTWTAMGAGLPEGGVQSLAIFDDGTGNALYVAGDFSAAGGVQSANIARWTGDHWEPVGSGTDDEIAGLAVLDDGSGTALFASGMFRRAGGQVSYGIAKWVACVPGLCAADFTGDDTLDFFDVLAFLQAFALGQVSADLTNDAVLDFFDVQMFLSLFAAGCP